MGSLITPNCRYGGSPRISSAPLPVHIVNCHNPAAIKLFGKKPSVAICRRACKLRKPIFAELGPLLTVSTCKDLYKPRPMIFGVGDLVAELINKCRKLPLGQLIPPSSCSRCNAWIKVLNSRFPLPKFQFPF